MRLIVTGARGQIAQSLLERAPRWQADVICACRPALDLAEPGSVARALADMKGDAIVNAAAYTAVDRAESEESLATRINGAGAGEVAEWAAKRGMPLLHISTDYVFDGALDRPYQEDDPVGPVGAYGRSKLAGERLVARHNQRAAIFRTSWVYSPFGANFVKTMLRLGETRDEVSVIADAVGAPTSALDLADTLFAAARKLLTEPDSAGLTGIFHSTGGGEASWADFAEVIFGEAERRGRKPVAVRRIATAEYPTQARRPASFPPP